MTYLDDNMLKNALKPIPTNKHTILDNITCPYCGLSINMNIKESWNQDHVIGRCFVPKGALDGQWNLQVITHRKCNNKKSDLENDISAITMQPDGLGFHRSKDENLKKEAKRKGKAISRLTKIPVKDSSTKFNIKIKIAEGLSFNACLTSPPQIQSNRVYDLCVLQMSAFFYFITYNSETEMGGFWPGLFHPVLETMRDDWGNPVNMKFMETVVDWETWIYGIGASDFYKVIIRHHPDAVCWSWAVEWNKNYRVIGFFGEEEPAKKIVNTFPVQNFIPAGRGKIDTGKEFDLGFRQERRLKEDEDKLFYLPDDENEKNGN